MSQHHVQEHIDLIAKQEQEFFASRTATERTGDAIAAFTGSLQFVALHIVLFVGWISVNSLPAFARWRFDPYPYSMFDTVVALEAILLASFILMRQSRTSRRADERAHLMLQVLLLTEKETTALLQINRQMAEQMGLRSIVRDRNVAALSQETQIEEVAENIKDSLPIEE